MNPLFSNTTTRRIVMEKQERERKYQGEDLEKLEERVWRIIRWLERTFKKRFRFAFEIIEGIRQDGWISADGKIMITDPAARDTSEGELFSALYVHWKNLSAQIGDPLPA
jgi:hypothetical protein